MDLFTLVLIFVGAAGVMLILFSVFSIKSDDDSSDGDLERQSALLNYLNLNTKIQDIDSSINEADNVLTELNDVSSSVIKEIDDKYQELLFLYNLIDEKKAKTSSDSPKEDTAVYSYSDTKDSSRSKPKNPFSFGKRQKVDYQISDTTEKTYKNPKLDMILQLCEEGLETQEIAKRLDLGSGEVSLIMALYASSRNKKKADEGR